MDPKASDVLPTTSHRPTILNNNTELENIESIKDLGVTFDSRLTFSLHINEKKIIKLVAFLELQKEIIHVKIKIAFLSYINQLARSHLEYYTLIVFGYHTLFMIKNVEKVKIRATKLLKEVTHLLYVERLKCVNLPGSQYRRFRGVMIMVYKRLTNIACQLYS